MDGALTKYLLAARSGQGSAADAAWAARGAFGAAFLLLRHRHPDEALKLVEGGPAQALASCDPRVGLLLGHLHELLDDMTAASVRFAEVSAGPEGGAAGRRAWPPSLLSSEESVNARLKWGLGMLPVTHESREEAAQRVREFVTGISALVADRLPDGQVAEGGSLRADIFSGFDTRGVDTARLAYLGAAMVPQLPELAAVYSRLHLRVLRGLGFVSPALLPLRCRRRLRSRPRVGYASGLFSESAVGNLARGIIAPLPREAVEVVLVSLGPLVRGGRGAQIAEALAARADRLLELGFWDPASPGSEEELRRAREAVAAEDLDALVYLELGLDVKAFVLAHSRLAPVQLVTYGHAMTSGIPTVDIFVSHSAFEPPGWARARYTEHLVLIPGLPHFARSIAPPDASASEDLDGPEAWARWRGMLTEGAGGPPPEVKQAHVYLVAQTLYKVVPAFDEALRGILAEDPLAVVVIRVGHPQPVVHRRIGARLAKGLPKGEARRVRFLPMQSADGYAWVLSHAHAMLDPFPHGGHTTTLDALGVGVPVVTLRPAAAEGALAGGFTVGFYEEMVSHARDRGGSDGARELMEGCVATGVKDYVSKACR